jgi:RluA family pseudouridine synthase
MRSWSIGKRQAGQKVIDFLKGYFEDVSNKTLKKWIDGGALKINGSVERFASTMIREKDWLEFAPPAESAKVEYSPERILFSDPHFFIYDKPVGIACDEKGIVAHLKNAHPQVRLIHRLDKETSGALLLSATSEMQKKLEEAFKERDVSKTYLAIVSGCPVSMQGKIHNRLGKIGAFSGQSLYGAVKQDGLEAITHWKVLKKGKSASLIECNPETGRTHQIRVHLAELGHPILGDLLYAKNVRCPYRPSRMLLHASKISFRNPATGEIVNVEAPLDDAFQEAMKALW